MTKDAIKDKVWTQVLSTIYSGVDTSCDRSISKAADRHIYIFMYDMLYAPSSDLLDRLQAVCSANVRNYIEDNTLK